MSTARDQHTATVLSNGIVLVSGGLYNNSAVNTAELYNPSTETWITTTSMNFARQGHQASVLINGSVLVTSDYISTSELYSYS